MKLKTIIVALAALILAACTSVEEPVPVNNETLTVMETPDVLSEIRAIEVAADALRQLTGSDAVSRSGSLPAATVSRHPALSRSSQTRAYIVNFDEGGYAVVCADPVDPQVLALNTEGSFDPSTQPGNAFFLELADDYITMTPRDTSELEPRVPGGTERPKDPNPGLAYIWHDGHRCGHVDETVTTIDKFKLMHTAWHQHYPYNKYCRAIDNVTGVEFNAVAGCVPVAMTQIMAFHKKPGELEGHVFDWETISVSKNLISGSKNADDVAYLIHRIGETAHIDYGYSASSVARNYIIPTFKTFGYAAVKETAYSEDIILNEVNAGRPVAIGAFTISSGSYAGHRWVIDGAYKTIDRTRNINLDTNTTCYVLNKSSSLYFHCDWGWNDSDGYYLSGVFNPKNYNFNEDYHVVYNIY